MVDPEAARPLKPVLIPPGTAHVDICQSLASDTLRSTALVGGWFASLPLDYLVKVFGKGDLRPELVASYPLSLTHAVNDGLLLRFLRLNCLTREYAPIWDALVGAPFNADRWTSSDSRLSKLQTANARWESAVPLRTALDRRQALVELDALVAIAIGWDADDLCTAYRTQFFVLRKVEQQERHDQNGHEVPKEVWTGYLQDPEGADLGRYVPPFTKPDREAEMRRAYIVFAQRYGGGVA